jgi:hypothetical protein
VQPFLQGFYSAGDRLEEIDGAARRCSAALAAATLDNTMSTSCNAILNEEVSIRARIFQSPPLNGGSRVVVFSWDTARPDEGGPSAICAAHPALGCATTYPYSRFFENGTVAESGMVSLDHVVNVLTPTGPSGSGEYRISFIPSPDSQLQIYAFSFNSASPAGNPNINWDAIFPATLIH